jgi:hypothetical protein
LFDVLDFGIDLIQSAEAGPQFDPGHFALAVRLSLGLGADARELGSL